MGRLSLETRARVVILWKNGMKLNEIRERLAEEGKSVSRVSLWKLVKKFSTYESIIDCKRNPRSSLLNMAHYEFIDKSMLENDELTARLLKYMIQEAFPSVTANLSLQTVRRARIRLGWVSTTPKYCQLIRQQNKEKRLKWCSELDSNDDFANIIWTDECSVQLQSHSLRCYRKVGQPKKLKPKPKHPFKIHLWGGISCKGATPLVLFTGKLCSTKLLKIFDAGLVPFIESVYGYGDHRLMQDNDPKHASGLTKEYFNGKGINWWHTPPESPDLNPIENIWGSMKRFLRDIHKPTNKESLIDGIRIFWKSLTPAVCTKYIHHIKKVIPKVIEENGGPSGF